MKSFCSNLLKGQCHQIFHLFWLYRFYLGPIWTGKNGFMNSFHFHVFTKFKNPDIQIFLTVDTAVLNFLIIAIGCANTPKYILLPDCSFKICEKPSKFSKSVRVVWRSQQLSRHRFFANIFVIMKEFAKPFLPVHIGPRLIF